MSYCFNPNCLKPQNSDKQDRCSSCNASLLWQQRYRGIKLLGKSQLALTIEVIDIQQKQSLVLKILLTNYPKAVELFEQEARILRELDYVGIPKIAVGGYFSFQPQWHQNPLPCLAIKKVAGLDLQQWLQQRNYQPISQQQAQNWLKQLLKILAQLHKQQYFHRDIKPSNIILQPDGNLVLIDFGAARKITNTYLGKVGTSQGVTSIGTPGYIAPEQIDGAALPQSDFFALGRTCIHLLTGKHPQELPKNADTGRTSWRDLAPQVSPAFAELLDLMMERLPVKRPANIEAINHALLKIEQFPHQPLIKSRFKSKILLQLLGGILLLPISTLGLVVIRNRLNAPLCNNLTCVNRDPIDNKCDRQVQTITSNIGNYQINPNKLKAYRLEIRFSNVCQATWVRSQAPVGSSHYIEDSQGKKYGTAIVPVDQWSEHYADMAPGKDIKLRACAEPTSGKKSCTNFVQL